MCDFITLILSFHYAVPELKLFLNYSSFEIRNEYLAYISQFYLYCIS